MFHNDFLEDDCELDRYTVEELKAWLKHLGMKVVDKHGDTVPLDIIAYTAELANSTTALRMQLARKNTDAKEEEAEQGLEAGKTYTVKEAAEIAGQEPTPDWGDWKEADAVEYKNTFGIEIRPLGDD